MIPGPVGKLAYILMMVLMTGVALGWLGGM